MQTFLPYRDFYKTAAVLDGPRLGKQRAECKQMLRALVFKFPGWRYHPATRMWAGNEYWLREYALVICAEWRSRGNEDTVLDWIKAVRCVRTPKPWWLGLELFHLSHRSNLTRKDPDWYNQFWSVNPNLEYFWPTRYDSRSTTSTH